MTQYCKKNNITSFSRNRGGWFKRIERFDRYHEKGGGWAFVGSNFTKVGNFESNLRNGLYIDCSKKEVDGKIEETINIFEINQDSIKVIQSGKKTNKWAYDFYDKVEEWFQNKQDNDVQNIIDAINGITDDNEKIREAFEQLMKNDKFKNTHEVLGYLQRYNLAPVPSVDFVKKYSEHNITRTMAQKYKGGYSLADEDLDFIEVVATHIYDIDIKNCKIIADSIEPHQLKSKSFYDDLEEIGDVEKSNLGKTVGWYFANKRCNHNGVDNRYNILIVTANKKTETIYLKYCDIWVDWMTFW